MVSGAHREDLRVLAARNLARGTYRTSVITEELVDALNEREALRKRAERYEEALRELISYEREGKISAWCADIAGAALAGDQVEA